MSSLKQLEHEILATGKVDSPELEALRHRVYVDGKVHRPEADFLVELYKRVPHRSPAFNQFYYGAIKNHILANGRINAEETAWLRQMLLADDIIDDEERRFLHELKGEAKSVGREFESLFRECMKQPAEQRTCG